VPPFLVQMLREHKAASPFSQDTDYVFTTGSGKPFGWSNVDRQGLHKARERAKLRQPNPRFHDLRHTFVSILIGQGQPVSYVADQVGDSVETTLRTYAHLFDKATHSEKSRAAMEAAFGNSVVTGASETSETPKRAAVVDIASKQGKGRETPKERCTVLQNRGLKVRVLPALSSRLAAIVQQVSLTRYCPANPSGFGAGGY
jgi:Phage integrase family